MASTIWTLGSTSPGSISFTYLDGVQCTQDVGNFWWNQARAQLSVACAADQTGIDSINTYFNQDTYWSYNSGITGLASTGTTAAHTVSSSRGTGSVPTISNTGDFIGKFSAFAYTGTTPSYQEIGAVNFYASGTNGAASGIGGEMRLATKQDNGVEVEWVKLLSTGIFSPLVDNTVSLGAVSLGWSAFYAHYAASTTPGTAVTINGMSGRFQLSAGNASIVVTNSLITVTSIVMVMLETNDATATFLKSAVPANGSFTVTVNANATATVKFSFFVVSN